MNSSKTYRNKAELKNEIEKLAEEAFHRHLISGYGNGESANEYQIVYEGKPRHFTLEYALHFLKKLIQQNAQPQLLTLDHSLDLQ